MTVRRLLFAIRHWPCRWQQLETRVVRKDGEMYETCQCGWRSGGWDVPQKALQYQRRSVVKRVWVADVRDIRSRRRRQG